MNEGEMKNAINVDIFSTVIDILAFNLERSIGLEWLSDSARQKICEEAKRYFEKGSCRLENDIKIVCLNPTMLDHATLRWTLHYSLCPFDGYLPLVKEELDTSIKSKMMIRSCQKILKNLLSFYRKRLIDGKTFELFFYLEDALEFCYSENFNKFDVIDCSNVADHVGLANLILACSGKLSDHPSATGMRSLDHRTPAPGPYSTAAHHDTRPPPSSDPICFQRGLLPSTGGDNSPPSQNSRRFWGC